MLMCVFHQVPLSVIVAWILGIKMDLNFNILETSSLALAIIITAFTLQVKRFALNTSLIWLTFLVNHYRLFLGRLGWNFSLHEGTGSIVMLCHHRGVFLRRPNSPTK